MQTYRLFLGQCGFEFISPWLDLPDTPGGSGLHGGQEREDEVSVYNFPMGVVGWGGGGWIWLRPGTRDDPTFVANFHVSGQLSTLFFWKYETWKQFLILSNLPLLE